MAVPASPCSPTTPEQRPPQEKGAKKGTYLFGVGQCRGARPKKKVAIQIREVARTFRRSPFTTLLLTADRLPNSCHSFLSSLRADNIKNSNNTVDESTVPCTRSTTRRIGQTTDTPEHQPKQTHTYIHTMAQTQTTFPPGRDDTSPFQHSHSPAEHAALIQSRETGDILPDDTPRGGVKALPFAKSWVHFMAGG